MGRVYEMNPNGGRYCSEEAVSLLGDSAEKGFDDDVNSRRRPPRRDVFEHARIFTEAAHTAWSSRPPFLKVLRSLGFALLPSFIQALFRPSRSKVEKMHPTSFLDGMRGIAALFVVWCHMSYVVFVLGHAYGYRDNRNVMSLPFIRLIYGGAPMVSIFFVISGYALSLKPLKQMRSRSYDGLLQTLSSGVFRRPFRLFLPCIISTFIVLLLVQMGAYEYTRAFKDNKDLLRNFDEFHQDRLETLNAQLHDWSEQIFDFIHVWCSEFVYAGTTRYDLHLWTIPAEFRASLALFLSHFAVARMTTPIRISTVLGLIVFAHQWDRWEMILFWGGMLLAEIDLIKAARTAARAASSSSSLGSPYDNRRHTSYQWAWTSFWILNCICGMYFASYPEDGGIETPGFMYIAEMVPAHVWQKYRYWQGWGAIQITWAICNEKLLQQIFTTKPINYLGKISYAMYLMHGPVLHTFGYTILPLWWKLTGTNQGWFELGFFFAACCNTVAIIWAGDLFWRFFDIPCVKFARWAETKCIHGS